MQIEHWDERADGSLTEENMVGKMEARGYRVSCRVLPAGARLPAHSFPADKIDGVLSGRFRLVTREGAVTLGPGDCVVVPAGTVHRAEVMGRRPAVTLDAIRVGF